MPNVLETLKERGFVENTTHDQELQDYLNKDVVTCYIGFDPTASSLHIGSLVPIMSLAHIQRHGHRPIALVGGGTGMVGDPSGKTEARQLLTPEIIEANANGIKKQLSQFIQFKDDRAILLNNADWLNDLRYIPFLRDIGRHFSVNRMIKAESYKMRLDSEEGLNFIEFNYMLLQAYDFLNLFDTQDCHLQMGGSDQWGNIVAGIELIRRVHHKTAFGITFPLITTSSGEKMGKTAKGAIWLDPTRTTPYEYYQFWVNTDDKDVEKFLALFTFLPMEEIRKIGELQAAELNYAKSVLAYETTRLAHGDKQATEALRAAASVFGAKKRIQGILSSSTFPDDASSELSVDAVPSTMIESNKLNEGIPAFKLFTQVGLAKSGGAARRLIEQGGAYLNDVRVEQFDKIISLDDFISSEIILRAGKKRYHKISAK
ncbi:tyrosine--tRNA ligase [Desulfococcaceae bacterium HSG9]|nr:tyrosine--tRNA ligase [Desulfococcaceae bacterium HSG9]